MNQRFQRAKFLKPLRVLYFRYPLPPKSTLSNPWKKQPQFFDSPGQCFAFSQASASTRPCTASPVRSVCLALGRSKKCSCWYFWVKTLATKLSYLRIKFHPALPLLACWSGCCAWPRSFHDTHKVYSRLEAMKVAKEQAKPENQRFAFASWGFIFATDRPFGD